MIEVEVGPVQASSSIYETEAWGVSDQQSFLNIALQVEYYDTPTKLLKATKKIELDLGRTKTSVWGPRVIDIDILLFDDIVMQAADLTIPHSQMTKRNFVLYPMAELAPDLLHPAENKTMQELLDECTDTADVSIIKPEHV